MDALRDLWHRLIFAATSFAIAVLPEEVKRSDRLSPWATPAAHIASGVAEVALAVGLFLGGAVAYVRGFTAGPGSTYLFNQPGDLGYHDFFGMGALGYISYLFTPPGMLSVYCVAEGGLRALEAAFSGRMLGCGVVWAGWRTARALRGAGRSASQAARIGPERPDELVLPEASGAGLLEIYSVEDKPWSEVQVVELDGRFFRLATKSLVPHGRWHAWRYELHLLEQHEVIRGAIITLAPPQPADPPAAASAPVP